MTKHEAYLLGARDALYAYAWCRDGSQYVGNCGTLLKQARDRLAEERCFHWVRPLVPLLDELYDPPQVNDDNPT